MELKNINMEKELKKGDVCVKVTDKNRKKIKEILEMFGEKVYSSDTLFKYRYIMYSLYNCTWSGNYGIYKIIVKPKHLKAILSKEYLKAGDYIVLDNGNEIVKIKSISDGKICVDKHRMKQSDIIFTDGVESTRDFDRYATKEEIEFLEEKVKNKLQVGKWYKYKYKLGEKDGYLLFNFNGTIGNDSQYGFTHTSHGQNLVNNISVYRENISEYHLATHQEVEEAFIKEARRRYKVGDKVKSLSSSNLDGVLNFEYIDYYTSDDLWISSELTRTCVYCKGKWADVAEVDKFAELKEAYNNGDSIEFKNILGDWCYTRYPVWNTNNEYRIKPEEPIKVGDVCKFWNDNDESVYEVGSVLSTDGRLLSYKSTSGWWYTGAKKVTKEEAIDLLFNKK